MQEHSAWTQVMDDRLIGLRAAGLPWDLIGREMGLGMSRVRERGRRLGAVRMPMRRAAPVPDSRDRPALPPGHPACWKLITDGTVLDGEAYPFPVFL
jgi:hypothetical protein